MALACTIDENSISAGSDSATAQQRGNGGGNSTARHPRKSKNLNNAAFSIVLWCGRVCVGVYYFQGDGDRKRLSITLEDLTVALKDVKPSISVQERQRFTDM